MKIRNIYIFLTKLQDIWGSLQTSFKTRIETLLSRPALILLHYVLYKLPLKQGLKHKKKTKTPAEDFVLYKLPLKQGLKRM